jgi:uncharacterized protein YneF (UPF0154 family)
MEKLVKALPVIIALSLGVFLGCFFTNNRYTQKEAASNKTNYTAICRLELRDGNKGDVKEKYIALLEYRGDSKEFCDEHMPLNNLPADTNATSLNSLQSEDNYTE